MTKNTKVKIVRINRPGDIANKEKNAIGEIGTVRKISRGGMILVAYGKNKEWFFKNELEIENEA